MSMRGDAGNGWRSFGASTVALLLASHVAAQTPPPARGVYTCVDSNGKRWTSDRTVPQCAGQEQRVLNPDGSLNHIEPPTLTADERADVEMREREAAADKVARQDAMRRDRNLMQRFPNEAAHKVARDKALDDIRSAIRLSETRISALLVERKPLADEAEFYVGKSMPSKLKNQLDANEASLGALRSLTQNQQGEVVRINALYDVELARLKKLWAGAQPGSMGPAGSAPAPALKPAVEPPLIRAKATVMASAAAPSAAAQAKSK